MHTSPNGGNMEEDVLIDILEASVKKNGEKTLTNLWLLNILKLYKKEIEDIDKQSDLIESYYDING
jgi:hypothetical protein